MCHSLVDIQPQQISWNEHLHRTFQMWILVQSEVQLSNSSCEQTAIHKIGAGLWLGKWYMHVFRHYDTRYTFLHLVETIKQLIVHISIA